MEKACVQVDSKGAALGSNQGEEQEDEVEVDINLLPEKEKNKTLNQRIRDAKKVDEKAEKEAQKAKDKAKKEDKKAEKSWNFKASTPPLILIETSIALQLQNLRKRDASYVQLLVSTLQQIISPTLMDSIGGALYVQEFFSRSLQTTDTYFMQHKAFPKEWVDIKAFLEKVISFSC